MKASLKPLLLGGLELAAILAAFGLGELFLRLTQPIYVLDRSLHYEPAVFARHVFPQERQSGTSGGVVMWPINAQGYRAESDFSVEKPPGLVRIVILGGSAVFDPLASGEQDWPHRVGDLLNQAGHNVEVINAGIPGHATPDSLGRLYSEIWMFEPDYVLLYQCWNDIKYFTQLTPTHSLLRTFKPLDSTQAAPLEGCVSSLDCALVHRSQLYLRLRMKYLTWKLNLGPEGIVEEVPLEERSTSFGEVGPAQYKLDLQTFVDVTRNIGAMPVLITQARLVAPDNSPEDMERIEYDYVGLTHDALVDAFAVCDQMTAEVAQEKNVPMLDLSPELTGNSTLFQDHIHLSQEGSQRVAEEVADYMDKLLNEAEQ